MAEIISIVVPLYNEEEVLDELHSRLGEAAGAWQEPYEVVAVDDGSRDATWAMLTRIASTDTHWRGVRLSRNFGHQPAVSTGIEHAKGDAIVVIDADLQDPPEIIVRLLEQWRNGYDVVYAIRRNRKESPLMRFLYGAFYRLLHALSDTEIPEDSGDFALISRRVAEQLRSLPERHRFLRGLRAWVGFKQIGIEYDRAARAAGCPKYTFSKLFRLAFDGLLSFSVFPLRLLAYSGVGISALSLVAAIYYIIQRLVTDQPVPGFATLVVLVLFLGGAQLIGLGTIGEYVGRIYEEAKHRPIWIVSETVGFTPPPVEE